MDPFAQPEKDAKKVEAGRLGAQARKAKAAELQAKASFFEDAPLDTPEHVRSYLQAILRAVATGALDSKAAAAGASVASKLIASFAISISDELKALRARNDECVRLHQQQHHQGVSRRR